MVEILKHIIPFLGVAIGALILFILLRESVRSLKRWRLLRQRRRCHSLIGDLERLKVDEISALALELKKSFSLPLIEGVLDEYRQQATGHRPQMADEVFKKLSGVYQLLGIVDGHIKTLQEGRSWPERAEAAGKLGEIGHPQAVLPLITVLQDPKEDREVKSVAMRTLGMIRDERAIGPLIDALGLPDPATGQPLSEVLVQFGDVVIDPLMKVLSSSRREVQRFWAARILGRLKAGTATSTLLSALSDHAGRVRSEAARSLGNLGAHEGISPLTRMLLEDPVPEVREAVAEALGNIADDRALASLREGLSDLDYASRRRAMEALEKMGEKAYPFFLEALADHSKEASAQAASALERMGVVASRIEDLTGDDPQPAIEFLTQVAKAGVVETLARSLTHSELTVRIRLCRILSEGVSPRTFEALAEIAGKDPEWAARLEALLAMVKFSDVRAIPILVRALGEEEETLRERLLVALQGASLSLLEPLSGDIGTLLEDANVKVRVEAARVLARVHSDQLFPVLKASLADAAPEVRREAALALRYYQIDEGVKALIVALGDPVKDVRVAAVKSLGGLKDPKAIRSLAEGFEKADEGYRDDIAAALAAMPKEDFYKLIDHLMGLSHPKARAGVAWTRRGRQSLT